MQREKLIASSCAIAGITALMAPATADEGLPAYPVGVGTLYDAAYPKQQGLFLFNYDLYYTADSFKDGDGDDVFLDFDFEVAAAGFRPLYVWDKEVWGATPVSWAVIPVQYFEGEATVPTPDGPLTIGNDRSGIGDSSVGTVLNWYFGENDEWSFASGLEVYFPTGEFDASDPFNLGTNRYTFYPQASLTYRDETNRHVTLKALYGISTENDDTDYQSGDHLIIEAAAGIGLTEKLGVDLNGFALTQLTDDEQAGVIFPDGHKTNLYGIGAQIRYNIGGGAISFNYQHEFGAENAPEGERFWLKLGLPLWVPQ